MALNSLEETLATLGGIALTTLGSMYVGRAGSRSTHEGQKMQNELDWRKQLQEEMKDLRADYESKIKNFEARIEALENSKVELLRDLNNLGDFLDELSLFELYGRDDDEHPLPSESVAQYFDYTRWIRIKDMHDAMLDQRRRQAESGKDS